MFKEVIVATKNQGKLKEFSKMLGDLGINVRSLTDFDDVPEIVEDGETFEENARKKAEFIKNLYNLPTIADDSGLMVDILDGKPGIYSARFAGEEKNDQKNMEKLLSLLQDVEIKERTARFVSAIALAIPGEETIIVRGTCEGLISYEPRGKNGFGYDPIFYLPQYDKTMAEITPELKNQISHRSNALKELLRVIKKF
ncbi:non-canonical purine NTP pyrophosphatase [Vulcanibacillus modesticaldus]|uniref:dITP/XTP pyrophosphatase n=1 Tax=Vulcanibacillus modesticaldus TaxID=337097 RepID=A0A1D2YWD1_9BACI|nr:XTP/dITP diphosphatase [Vulcanibacillus modesticaldus]OEF99993.1 non-canonical purine NTP pyrophosphatase [Vulcanibacillus modesticaldus]